MNNYADISRKVSLAMRHQDKPCIGAPCDLDAPCKRHSRTADLVLRLVRYKQMNDKPGITVNITSPEIVTALRQHCRDNRNTVTGEYPTIDNEVEAILYFYLIGVNKRS